MLRTGTSSRQQPYPDDRDSYSSLSLASLREHPFGMTCLTSVLGPFRTDHLQFR